MKKSYQIILKSGKYRNRSELRLSSQFSDSTLVRAPLGFEVFESAGIPAPFVESVVLFLNGEFFEEEVNQQYA